MRSSRGRDFWLRLTVFSIVVTIMISLLALSSVSMKNHPRVADARNSITAHQFEEITFNASELPDASSDEENLIYIWYFGDGETAANEVVKHAYRRIGNYTATLVVIDNDGAKSIDSVQVSIVEMEVKRDAGFSWLQILGYVMIAIIALLIVDILLRIRKGRGRMVEEAQEAEREENTDEDV